MPNREVGWGVGDGEGLSANLNQPFSHIHFTSSLYPTVLSLLLFIPLSSPPPPLQLSFPSLLIRNAKTAQIKQNKMEIK